MSEQFSGDPCAPTHGSCGTTENHALTVPTDIWEWLKTVYEVTVKLVDVAE
jgi:hypothetical protein